ncbi:tripartite motif-containing protein 35-like [Chanos chanos]|uniref:Tripartite motif-containing protein 35-like n=1 Tax=Chanos chanos TaxID=29144 RepID=A0A6J2W5R9_CHACN|nr:tripartite motif-containing protein 35-like [Chanos chanos]
MASKHRSEEDLTCPVCCDIYTDPVILSCSHSICRICLYQLWKTKGNPECPVCGTTPSKSTPLSNLALKNLCEIYLQERSQKTSTGSEEFCSLHNEKLKLFCLEDKEPVCVACRDSRKHENHNCCPIDEAAEDHKDQLKTALKPLQKKLEIFENFKLTFDKMAEHVKVRTELTERLIKKEFEELHEFLRDEEAARITALREEEEQKSQMIRKKTEEMSREISSLSDKVKATKEEIKAEKVSFLKNFDISMKRAQCTLQDPQMLSGALINVAKHLGNLKFRVWEKMQNIVPYIPVILDPNTAESRLVLSEDLTSARLSLERKQLSENPERFEYGYPCVLGSEGFDSGTHCWDVEVKDITNWALGVITESVQRKPNLVKSGQWCVEYYFGEYDAHSPIQSQPVLLANNKLQRVRVQLDWERGKLSLSDPLNNTHIHTFTHTFTERVFPFFCNNSNLYPLTVLPMTTSRTGEK